MGGVRNMLVLKISSTLMSHVKLVLVLIHVSVTSVELVIDPGFSFISVGLIVVPCLIILILCFLIIVICRYVLLRIVIRLVIPGHLTLVRVILEPLLLVLVAQLVRWSSMSWLTCMHSARKGGSILLVIIMMIRIFLILISVILSFGSLMPWLILSILHHISSVHLVLLILHAHLIVHIT